MEQIYNINRKGNDFYVKYKERIYEYSLVSPSSLISLIYKGIHSIYNQFSYLVEGAWYSFYEITDGHGNIYARYCILNEVR